MGKMPANTGVFCYNKHMTYKDYIDNKKIDCPIIKHSIFSFRRVIKIPFKYTKSLNKKAVFIMMNPSKATKYLSDTTLDRILNYAHSCKKYSEVIILNTISLYEPNSKDLKGLIEKVIKEIGVEKFEVEQKLNIDAIQDIINKLSDNDDIYLATGNPKSKYGSESMKKLYDGVLKNKSVFAFKSVREDSKGNATSKGFTFHPSRQHDSFFEENNKFEFIITGYGDKNTRRNDVNTVRSLVRVQQEP